MPLEQRRWFQAITIFIAAASSGALMLHLGSISNWEGSRGSLVLLSFGATLGFDRILILTLPLLLAKVWPSLGVARR